MDPPQLSFLCRPWCAQPKHIFYITSSQWCLLFSIPSFVFYPDHIFLLINPPNMPELNNLAFWTTAGELHEHIFPMCPPGVAYQVCNGYGWRIWFTGSPCDSRDHELIVYMQRACLPTTIKPALALLQGSENDVKSFGYMLLGGNPD